MAGEGEHEEKDNSVSYLKKKRRRGWGSIYEVFYPILKIYVIIYSSLYID